MELALLPITAILLLLSGASAPARAAVRQASAAALMREFLGSQAATARAQQALAPAGNGLAHFLQPQADTHTRAGSLQQLCRTRLLVPGPVPGRICEKKQFRTRFGFPEGAYRALAPPVA